jgi:type I restriction enzyme M protein
MVCRAGRDRRIILLPDNLFYNTTAPGIIIVLNRQKAKSRQGKIVLVNAAAEFKKGQPKNYIPEEGIHKIADAFLKGEDMDKFVKVITAEEAAKNDHNLSPSRYVGTATEETYRQIPEIVAELREYEQRAAKVTKELNGILKQLGVAEQERES